MKKAYIELSENNRVVNKFPVRMNEDDRSFALTILFDQVSYGSTNSIVTFNIGDKVIYSMYYDVCKKEYVLNRKGEETRYSAASVQNIARRFR